MFKLGIGCVIQQAMTKHAYMSSEGTSSLKPKWFHYLSPPVFLFNTESGESEYKGRILIYENLRMTVKKKRYVIEDFHIITALPFITQT